MVTESFDLGRKNGFQIGLHMWVVSESFDMVKGIGCLLLLLLLLKVLTWSKELVAYYY